MQEGGPGRLDLTLVTNRLWRSQLLGVGANLFFRRKKMAPLWDADTEASAMRKAPCRGLWKPSPLAGPTLGFFHPPRSLLRPAERSPLHRASSGGRMKGSRHRP